MATSKAPKAGSDGPLLKTWRQEGATGARAKLWLNIRRATIALVAICLLGALGYLLISPLFQPRSYFAYFALDGLQTKNSPTEFVNLAAPPVEFVTQDFNGFVPLKSAFTPLANSQALRYVSMASRELVEKQLSDLEKSNLKANDTLILFISTHGLVRDGKALLMCSEFTDTGDEQASSKGLLEVAELVERIEKIPARAKLILLDVGRWDYSPRLGIAFNTFAEALESEVEALNLASTYVVTSCSAGEASHVSYSKQRSIFGYVAAAGLQGEADLNEDGEVHVDELYEYIRFNAAEWVKNATDKRESQTPVLLGAGSRGGGGAHLLFSRGLPEVTEEVDSDGGVVGSVISWMGDEVDSLNYRAVTGNLDPSKITSVFTSEEDEEAEEEDAKPPEAKPSDPQKLYDAEINWLKEAWRLTNEIEASHPSPVEFAPHLWRRHKDRLLWLEQMQQSGLPEARQFLEHELDSLNDSLKAYSDPDKTVPTDPENVVDEIIKLRQSVVPFQIDPDRPPTMALAQVVAQWDLKQALDPESKLLKFDNAFQQWVNSPDEIAVLGEILKQHNWDENDDWKEIYEYQLIDPLRQDEEVPLAIIKLAFRVRRLGEQSVSDLLWGQRWADDHIGRADRLRLEAERLLIHKASRDWQDRAERNLQRAEESYRRAVGQLTSIRDAQRLHQAILTNGRDYLRWCQYSAAGNTATGAPSANKLGELFAAMKVPTTGAPLKDLKDPKDLLRDAVDELTAGGVADNASHRMTSLLRTALLDQEDRISLIEKRRRVGDDHELQAPNRTPPEALSQERLDNAADQLRAEAEFIDSFVPASVGVEPSADEVAISWKTLGQEAENLRSRLSELPALVLRMASESESLSRKERLDQLRQVYESLSVIDSLDVSEGFEAELLKTNLTKEVYNAQWFDLLAAMSQRYQNAMADAPPEEREQLKEVRDRTVALATGLGPRMNYSTTANLALEIATPQTGKIALDANDSAQVQFTIVSDKPVWILAQYDEGLIDVSSGDGTIYKEHQIRAAAAGDSEFSREYPYRPRLGENQSPSWQPINEGQRTFTLRVTRNGNAQGDGTLVLRAITDDEYIRRQVPLGLPGYQDLEILVNGRTITDSSDVLSLYPGQVQEISMQVVNKGSEAKTYKASIYTASEAPAFIPSGTMESGPARTILEKFKNRREIAHEAEVSPSPRGFAPIKFNFGSPDNLILLGADPAKGKSVTEIDLSGGLLLDVVDEEQKHILRWIKLDAKRPWEYLQATAKYFPTEPRRVVVTFKGIDNEPETVPPDDIKVELQIDKDYYSSGGIESTFLLGPDYSGELEGRLNGRWPTSGDPVQVRIMVDGYPRAFIFGVPNTSIADDVPLITNNTSVRVLPPEKDEYEKTSFITAKVEVDAPRGHFDSGRNYVHVGIDRLRDNDLTNDLPPTTRNKDRHLQFFAQKPEQGTLAIRSRVSDFELPLRTEGITGRVFILGKMGPGDQYEPDVQEIVIDGAGPQLDYGSSEIKDLGDKLVVDVRFDDELTRVSKVEASYDSGEWQEGKVQANGRWQVELDVSKLTAGQTYDIKVRGTDAVNNETVERLQPWTKGEQLAETEPAKKPADAPPPGPVKNRVFGKLKYGENEVTKIVVTLEGPNAPTEPAQVGQKGTFFFEEVPAGDYRLIARAEAAGNPRGAEMDIKVSNKKGVPTDLKEITLGRINPR